MKTTHSIPNVSKLRLRAIFNSFLLCIFLWPTISLSDTNDKVLQPITLEVAQQLAQNHSSFLIFKHQAHGVSPSFSIAKYRSKHGRIIRDDSSFELVPYKVNLQGLSHGYYFLPLEPGIYQITAIESPHFNLPYFKETDYDENWRFVVHPNAISYLGEIFIAEERSRNFVEMSLRNRYATSLAELNTISAQFAGLMMSSAAYIPDNFPNLMSQDS